MDIDPDVIDALTDHGARGVLTEFLAQGEGCGWCRRPVRLSGERYAVDPVSGARRRVFSSHDKPGGVVLKACGNRRETRCPTCAAVYRADARHLVKAGLQGGKGVAESVASHPAVLLTLTAPSFGPVHRSKTDSPCRPASPSRRCVHGRPVGCFARHHGDDALVGSPLCPDCYDYEAAVLHNAVVPELWRRTSLYIPRHLARHLGLTQAQCRARYRVSYLRVAEFQRRGAVHLHVVVRLDDADGGVPDASVDTLVAACLSAAQAVAVGLEGQVLAWGTQLDVAVLHREESRAGRLAAYVAKYATKSSERSGALDDRILDEADLVDRRLPDHERRLAETAWTLGGVEELSHLRLRRYAHVLGYGGQFLCKS
ncbi:MAG TPA: replication initiator, partial [Acidimicrobiales bacterium]|nr:replication initiator [Acidimicrobiales bacterium]